MATLSERIKRAWNVFTDQEEFPRYSTYGQTISSYRPDRPRLTRGNEKSIISAIYNRIAVDISQIDIRHIRLDDQGRYLEDIDSNLNDCLTLESNIDQTAKAFKQDAIMTMFDEGCVAIVPVDTIGDPKITKSYDILSMRTGRIIEWMPRHVRINIYNDKTGKKEDVILPKDCVAIVENPLYSIMNEPNSTLQRLIRKLNLLDVIDEQSGAGKLDLIIQLPYVVKTPERRQQAENRRKDIEMQLAGSKYGIAYTDGTEHITQLNRSLDNNLMHQIEYLTEMVYGQLGITKEILNGSADDQANLNYEQKTLIPLVSAIVDEMKRKFLTKTARSQGQSIDYFRDPFKLVPVSNLADLADKFTRNEIMSSNELRQIVGLKPSSDPQADQLRNKNINATEGQEFAKATDTGATTENTNQDFIQDTNV